MDHFIMIRHHCLNVDNHESLCNSCQQFALEIKAIIYQVERATLWERDGSMCSIKTEGHKNPEKQNDLVLMKYSVVVIDYHHLDGSGVMWSNHRASAEY